MNSASYILNVQDFDALNRLVEKKRNGAADWLVRWGLPIFAYLMGFMGLLELWRNRATGLPNSDWLIFFGPPGFYLLATAIDRLSKARAHRKFLSTPYFGTTAHLRLEAEGVRVKGVYGESLVYWGSILRVEETPTHIFLFLDPKQALIVPKRIFASPTDAGSFHDVAQRFWLQAHPAPVAPPLATP